jgi:hypothetical protein
MKSYTLPRFKFVMDDHTGRTVVFTDLDTGETVEVEVASHDRETGTLEFVKNVNVPFRYMIGLK